MKPILVILGFLSPWILAAGVIFGGIAISGSVPPPFHTPVCISAAAWAETQQDPVEALRYLDQLGDRYSNSSGIALWKTEMHRLAALDAFLTGDFITAVNHYLHSDTSDNLDYFSAILLGISYQKLGRTLLAEQVLTNAAARHPRRHDAYIALGHLNLRRGNIGKAQEYYSLALAASPELGLVWVDIGDALRAAGNEPSAYEAYERAGQVDPYDPVVRLRIAETALYKYHDKNWAESTANAIEAQLPHWKSVNLLKTQIKFWNPGDPKPYLSTAVFHDPAAAGKRLAPGRVLYEYQRESYHGYNR